MNFRTNISPEMAANIKADADQRKVSEAHIVRCIIASHYGLPDGTPRKWAPDPAQAHSEIPVGANI